MRATQKAEAPKGDDLVLKDLGLSEKPASGSALFLDTAKIYHYTETCTMGTQGAHRFGSTLF